MSFDFIQDKNVITEVKAFISLMKGHKIEVKSVILFGSFAKNKAHEDSDIDLAVVSDKFEEDEIEEMMTLKKLSIKVSNRIEPIPLRESYLESKYDTFIGEIKKYGKVLYSS